MMSGSSCLENICFVALSLAVSPLHVTFMYQQFHRRSLSILITRTFLQAEKIASRMIYEDRMRGSIDQVKLVNCCKFSKGFFLSLVETVIFMLYKLV